MCNAGKTSIFTAVGAPAALLFCCLGPAGCGVRANASRVAKPVPTAAATGTTDPAPPVAAAAPLTPAAQVTTAPSASPAGAAAMVDYEDRKSGFRLAYPAGWRPKKTDEYVLMLVPVAPAAGDPAVEATRTSKSDNDGALAGSKITVDVPWIPPHLPGMITLDRVEGGYMDDQKARFADVKVTAKSDPVVPKAKARRLVLTGHAKAPGGSPGPAYTVVTLLEIHSERVYLVSTEARTEDFPAVLADFEKVAASMQWTK